jgi:hypothetical protein
MTNGGMNNKMASKICKCKIPLKVRIFLWQTFQDRLQTGQQLNARNWKGRGSYCLCGKMKNVDHLLLECSMAMFIWSFLGEALRWEGYPRNMDDLKSNWLTQGFGVSYQTGLACFIEFTWVIWNTRTKMIMQDVFPINRLMCYSLVSPLYRSGVPWWGSWRRIRWRQWWKPFKLSCKISSRLVSYEVPSSWCVFWVGMCVTMYSSWYCSMSSLRFWYCASCT